MPRMRCEKDGESGYKWGENGVCFTGPDAKDRADSVGRAIHAQRNENLFELSENVSERVQIAKTGTFNHTVYGKFSISAADLEKMKNGLDNNVRRQEIEGRPVLPFDYMHAEADKAAGWITGLKIENDKSGGNALFARVEWTPKAAEKIRNKEFKFVSPSIRRNYEDAETGKKFDIVLKGATLTNVPFLRDMQAVHLLSEKKRAAFESLKLSEDSDINHLKDENMPDEKIIKAFKAMSLEEQTEFLTACDVKRADEKLSEDFEKTKNDLKLAEKKIDEFEKNAGDDGDKSDELKLAEGEIKDLKEKVGSLIKQRAQDQKKSQFDLMLSDGKVCEAQREPFMENDIAKFAENAQEVKLDESGVRPKGDESANDAEMKVEKLAEEKMKENKDLEFGDAVSLVLSEKPELSRKLGY